jgi:hypothetical protein
MSHTCTDPRAAPESGRLVLRAGIAVTYSPRRPRRFLDRIDGILSCQLGLFLNFSAKKVEVRALLPSHTSSYWTQIK